MPRQIVIGFPVLIPVLGLTLIALNAPRFNPCRVVPVLLTNKVLKF
jgi:hypothetical protein